jgi:hypothetical protein
MSFLQLVDEARRPSLYRIELPRRAIASLIMIVKSKAGARFDAPRALLRLRT